MELKYQLWYHKWFTHSLLFSYLVKHYLGNIDLEWVLQNFLLLPGKQNKTANNHYYFKTEVTFILCTLIWGLFLILFSQSFTWLVLKEASSPPNSFAHWDIDWKCSGGKLQQQHQLFSTVFKVNKFLRLTVSLNSNIFTIPYKNILVDTYS